MVIMARYTVLYSRLLLVIAEQGLAHAVHAAPQPATLTNNTTFAGHTVLLANLQRYAILLIDKQVYSRALVNLSELVGLRNLVHHTSIHLVFYRTCAIVYIVAVLQELGDLFCPRQLDIVSFACFLRPPLKFDVDELRQFVVIERQKEKRFVDTTEEFVTFEVISKETNRDVEINDKR